LEDYCSLVLFVVWCLVFGLCCLDLAELPSGRKTKKTKTKRRRRRRRRVFSASLLDYLDYLHGMSNGQAGCQHCPG